MCKLQFKAREIQLLAMLFVDLALCVNINRINQVVLDFWFQGVNLHFINTCYLPSLNV